MDAPSFQDRMLQLERRMRHLAVAFWGTLGVLVLTVTVAWRSQNPDVLRARALLIVDNAGRERIVVGAPIPEPPGARIAPSTGLIIRDTAGAERFGLGLFPNGRMGMGFDAPPGTGDDRNRERINIVADPNGGAYVRFLNRRTAVVGYLRLAEDDRMWLEFMDVRADSVVLRRIGFQGEERTARPR